MKFYCSNCGKQLKHTRKAIPNVGVIVDLIAYHECSDSMIPFEIDPSAIVEAAPVAEKQKFVKSLNELKSTPAGKNLDIHSVTAKKAFNGVGTDDLRDRRFEKEEASSTAPSGILDQIKQMGNSIPVHDIKDDTSDSEMGG